MSRLIDADALMELVQKTHCTGCNNYNKVKCRACGIGDMLDYLDDAPTFDLWHYPSKGEIPDKDWSKHPANISKECWVVTKRGVGTIARWDNDYRMWFERPRLAVIDVVAWQYFIPPKKEYTY